MFLIQTGAGAVGGGSFGGADESRGDWTPKVKSEFKDANDRYKFSLDHLIQPIDRNCASRLKI